MTDERATPVAGAEGLPADQQTVIPAGTDPLKLAVPDTVETPPAEAAGEEGKSGEPGAEAKAGEEGKQDDDPKKRFRYNARISGLIDRARRAESERDALLAEKSRLRQPITNKPIEEMDYAERERLTHRQAYRDERIGEVDQRIRALDDDARGSVHEAVVAKIEAAAERIPKLSETLLQIPLTEETVDFLADSEKAPELVYYLGQNPEIAQQLYRMTFTGDGRRPGTATRASLNEAARLLGRLEAKIEAAPTARKATKAPPPGTTLNGRSAAEPVSLRELSDAGRTAEYVKRRKEQWAKGQH